MTVSVVCVLGPVVVPWAKWAASLSPSTTSAMGFRRSKVFLYIVELNPSTYLQATIVASFKGVLLLVDCCGLLVLMRFRFLRSTVHGGPQAKL